MNTVVELFNGGVDYVRGFTLPSISDYIPTWISRKTPDVSAAIVKDISDEPFAPEDAAVSTGVNPILMLIINIIYMILYYISIIVLASIIANDMIRSHWLLRLFGFCFSLTVMWSSYISVGFVAGYYIITALMNMMSNIRDKPVDPDQLKVWVPLLLFPRRYAFLPLMTSRGGNLDFLNPFSYFPEGESKTEAKYANFAYENVKYKTYLNTLIPNLTVLQKLGAFKFAQLTKKFNAYFYEINESYLKKSDKSAEEEADDDAAKQARAAIELEVKGAIYSATGSKESDGYIQKSFKTT
jgi:hypothetical protein